MAKNKTGTQAQSTEVGEPRAGAQPDWPTPPPSMPVIEDVIPSPISVANTPQTMEVVGANFVAEQFLILRDPKGDVLGMLSGAAGQLGSLTPDGFTFQWTFAQAGAYSVSVQSTVGGSSEAFALIVAAEPAWTGAAQKASAAPAKGARLRGKAVVHSSKVAYQGKVFSVTTDEVTEPGGVTGTRDVIRHNGSVVVLAVDSAENAADPLILLERQYRHAAGQFLLELPAGRIEPGEAPLAAAKRELIEETGYRARKWSTLVQYFASPGFLSEYFNVFLAEELTLGEAQPEEDEKIELIKLPLSELLEQIEAGKIQDGKTILSSLLFQRKRYVG